MTTAETSSETPDARIADHTAWAARGRWREAYDALHAEGERLRAEIRILTACNRGLVRLNEAAEARAITAEAQLAAAMEGAVRVKPLEWFDQPEGESYRIGRCDQVAYAVERSESGQWGYKRQGQAGLCVSEVGGQLFRGEEDAMRGADIDHKRRILAALEPNPAAQAERDALIAAGPSK
ncbi:hypothetical protein [Pararhodobacter marinus]|uniref:hypothetical protein n=1 Tax=Pararhodobacter marinus TaxID=2184063 RepID=UPI0035127F66